MDIEKEAEEYAKRRIDLDPIYANGLYYGFIAGAKWQAERMYSEEDMISFATFYYTHQGKATEYWGKDLFKLWFEQFKKK